MPVPTTLLLILLWGIVLYLCVSAFQTIYRTVRYRDMLVDLDAGRIAALPFQPAVSLVVRCDLGRSREPIPKIQRLMALNYAQFEVIVVLDAASHPEAFVSLGESFQMRSVPLPENLNGLSYPLRGMYRSESLPYKRLIFVDKPFHPDDDLRHTGRIVGRADFMIFVPTIDNSLSPDSLACLAIPEMRDPRRRVTRVRAAARYDCTGPLCRNGFRMMADLCNLRRLYVGGAGRGVDFGSFLTLEETSGRKGREEYVPQPLMFLHRPNSIRTYLAQLAPGMRFRSFQGRIIAGIEWAVAFIFWGTAIHALCRPHEVPDEGLLVASAFLLPLLASVFSVFVGEVLLRSDYSLRRIGTLLGLAIVESAAFCLLKPWMWIISLFRRPE
jgi:hypothetical protein